MSFPYSVMRSRNEKIVRIVEQNDDIVETKNIQLDFENQIKDVANKGLFIKPEHITFLMNNIVKFYRNNVAVLLLTMNLMEEGDSFVNTNYYISYIDYIFRKKENDEKREDNEKKELFNQKLSIQIKIYRRKINTILGKEV